MARKTDKRREDLRIKLLDLAEATIIKGGLPALKARTLATEAGCSVGAIYTVFGDLNDIVLATNGRTFQRLGRDVARAVQARPNASPADQLVIMGTAYLEFAADNTRAWRTLFDLEMSTQMNVPKWYLAELARLFGYIAGPLRQIYPDKPDRDIDLMTRALFSSVHGMVLLGLEQRISAIPRSDMENMIEMVLRGMARP
ncbi:TetR/AcrR family transcriptional regulator [Algirhabdus cladophorae]|uniref:TetR/AcrR family transcriptional regulator n=1 Tax=Algirhabdus cladophorae TaxID=3377108 RepID=UPI003B84B14E